MHIKFEKKFSQNEINKYAKISHDNNPIHKTGLVFGALLLATTESILPIQIRRINAHFMRPIYVGEVVKIIVEKGTFEIIVNQKECVKGTFD